MRILICLAFLCCPVPVVAQSYLVDFQDALNRCQDSLETTAGFSGDGLERVDEVEAELPSNVRDRQIWRFPSSPLQVVHSTYIDRDGQLRSTCEVSFLKGATSLTPEVREALFHSFVSKMDRQIAEGTHERRDPEKIPPIITFGYGPLKRGIHGCRVIISLAFQPEGDFFMVGAGEQITHPCNE